MAKTAPKPKISPLTWIVIISTLPTVWWYMNSDAPPPNPVKHAATKRHASSTDEFTPQDYTAKFAVLNQTPKNAFKPLIVRDNGTGGLKGRIALRTNGIPLDLAGGEGNWAYSGMAVINGKPTALVENSGTGEGVFLKVGEKWKRATVRKVTDTSLVLIGEDGSLHTMKIGDDNTVSAKDKSFAPLRPLPALTGPIGSLQVRPLPVNPTRSNVPIAQNDPTITTNAPGSAKSAN